MSCGNKSIQNMFSVAIPRIPEFPITRDRDKVTTSLPLLPGPPHFKNEKNQEKSIISLYIYCPIKPSSNNYNILESMLCYCQEYVNLQIHFKILILCFINNFKAPYNCHIRRSKMYKISSLVKTVHQHSA